MDRGEKRGDRTNIFCKGIMTYQEQCDVHCRFDSLNVVEVIDDTVDILYVDEQQGQPNKNSEKHDYR
jgi:hypothetical protein